MVCLYELISFIQSLNEFSIKTISFCRCENWDHPDNSCFRFTVDDINKGVLSSRLLNAGVCKYEYDSELKDLKIVICEDDYRIEFIIYKGKEITKYDKYRVEIGKKLKDVKDNNELARRLNLALEGKI